MRLLEDKNQNKDSQFEIKNQPRRFKDFKIEVCFCKNHLKLNKYSHFKYKIVKNLPDARLIPTQFERTNNPKTILTFIYENFTIIIVRSISIQ